MLIFRNFSFRKLLAGAVMLSVIAVLLVMISPRVSCAADPVVLTVTGDGVNNTVQFTMADLEALDQETHTYSGYNHWPRLIVFNNMTGPTLQTILNRAGLKPGVTLLRFKAGGSAVYTDYTKEQLLDTPRYYYFPDGDTNDCTDWPVDRNIEGRVQVPVILALNNSSGRLCFGQVAPNEPQGGNCAMLQSMCTGGTIYVSCAPPEKWGPPSANIPSGTTVVPGTLIALDYPEGTPIETMIYYTLDGTTDPDYGSYIYNISFPTFRPDEMNKPIPVNGEVTIKARLIGMGKRDSDVVTFHYNTGPPACTVQGKGLSQAVTYTVATLKGMAPAQGNYQCAEQGQTVTLAGQGVLLGTLLDQLNVSGRWGVEFVTADGGKIEAGSVQSLKEQQCLLAYEVNGAEVADAAGDQTIYIQILRDSGDAADNRLKYVNTINLISVADEITISGVELLDCAGQPAAAVAPGGGYQVKALFANEMDTTQNALLIIQVRGGAGAAATGGGTVVGYAAAQTEVVVAGGEAAAEFTLPAGLTGKGYVDVFVWDTSSNHSLLGKDSHALRDRKSVV